MKVTYLTLNLKFKNIFLCMIKKFFRGIIDFILPQVCVSCNKSCEKPGSFLCNTCSGKLDLFENSHPWRDLYISKGYINGSFSLYKFIKDTPIQRLLHSMKYEKMKSIGVTLGMEIGKYMPADIKFDYTVPVPLHTAKSRERTYNQSDYICRGISRATSTEIMPNLLKRIRYTGSQTKLNKIERIENVRGAFAINEKFKGIIAGKNIIIADDVITTGSTILECARVLKENDAGYVMACSAAYDALD